MDMEKLRLGAIGVGGMGGSHAKLAAAHERVDVVCVADLDQARAAQFGTDLAAAATTDYRDLLARDDVDAVVVSTPNPLHYAIALECLQAGKHTAVEYPIAQTVEEYDALCRTADERGVLLLDILTPAVEPQPLLMAKLAPRIGKVMTMRSVYTGGPTDWYSNTARRGNFFAALTIHNIVYYNVLLGESPLWVDGALHLDDGLAFHSGHYMSQYPCGALAFNEWHMGSTNGSRWQWAVEGEKGRLVFDRERYGGDTVKLVTRDGEEEFSLSAMADDAHALAIDSLVRQALDEDAPPYVTRTFSRDILRICEAAQRSAAEGRRIRLV